MIYLDNASTTKPLNSVTDKVVEFMTDKWHNPSSLYSKGKEVKKDIEDTRRNIAKLINAKCDEIYFTSGATESNNWIIRGFDDYNFNRESVIITTPIEHKSIIEAVCNPVLHSELHFCKVNSEGIVDINSLKELLELTKGKQILVSIIMANNEIGILQNIKEISDLVHKYNGVFHTDVTQALSYIPIDVNEMGIDLLSASAQKIGGLKGCGFLFKKENIKLLPLIYGNQERKYRGGTENVIGIIALGEAIKNIDYNTFDLIGKRNYMIDKLVNELGCKVNGSLENRLPNNINVTFPQSISGESLMYLLDMSDIFIAVGSACNSESIEPSYVLKAIGLSDDEAMKTIRITLSNETTIDEINFVVEEIKKQIKLLDIGD
jgi:cysteine desulfurase